MTEEEQKLVSKIADIHGGHGWHIGIECAKQVIPLLKQAGYVRLSDDQSWDCTGKVFVVGLNPQDFVELLKGKGYRKVEL